MFPIAYGFSYLVDGCFLGLFAFTGTLSAWVPLAYVGAGIISSGVFFWLFISGKSELFDDPHLTLAQVWTAIIILLGFFALVPSVGMIFLGAMLIVCGFGSLCLTRAQAEIAFVFTALAVGIILIRRPTLTLFPGSGLYEELVFWMFFTVTLLRLGALGHIGSLLRQRVISRQRALSDALEELVASAEDLRLAKEAAEQPNQAKSMFLANMRHEIHTPLNGVIGMADLLPNRDLPEPERGWIKTIQASGEVLLSLLNNVLDISKVESGLMRIDRSVFSLQGAMSEIQHLLGDAALKKTLQLNITIDERLPEHVFGDAVRLRQVLGNLVSNAVKFTSQGGISISVQPAEGDRVRFEVQDSGIGVAKGKLQKIFEAFEQA